MYLLQEQVPLLELCAEDMMWHLNSAMKNSACIISYLPLMIWVLQTGRSDFLQDFRSLILVDWFCNLSYSVVSIGMEVVPACITSGALPLKAVLHFDWGDWQRLTVMVSFNISAYLKVRAVWVPEGQNTAVNKIKFTSTCLKRNYRSCKN